MKKGFKYLQIMLIEVDHKTCISKGFLEIIEKIGRETPVEIPEQPAERTTEDGEQHY